MCNKYALIKVAPENNIKVEEFDELLKNK